MDLEFFFRGMQNKETSASAWLATLLRHNGQFRRALFGLINVEPPIDPEVNWEIAVETELDGWVDVTLENAHGIRLRREQGCSLG